MALDKSEVSAKGKLLLGGALESALEIELRGKYHNYVEHREKTSFPRWDALRSVRPIQRNFSRRVRHQVETLTHELNFNTAVDRCIRYALWLLSVKLRSGKRRRGDSDLGLALLSVRMKPGEELIQEDIAAWCN